MRIGIDARPLNVGRGGIYRYTLALLEALAAHAPEHQIRLYGRPVPMSLPPGAEWATPWFPGKRWLDQLHLLGAARDIDLFHGTNYFIPLHASVPQVLTVHDLSVQLHPQTHPRSRRLQHRLLPSRCRSARRIVVDSESVRADLLGLVDLPPSRVLVVPLAAQEQFQPMDTAARERVQRMLRLPNRFLLYVGALEPRKNLPELLRAVAALRAAGASPPLVLAGSGNPSYEERIRSLSRELNLVTGHDLFMTGFVPEDVLPALYSSCTLLIYPSLYEGFGLPPLEAMACGAPVVIWGADALVELYADAALIVGPEGLASTIRRVLEDSSLRADLVRRGERRARARSWGDVAREMAQLYSAVVSQG